MVAFTTLFRKKTALVRTMPQSVRSKHVALAFILIPPRAFSQKRKEVPLPARRGDIALFVESHHMVELSHKLTMKNDEIFFAVVWNRT